MTRKKQRLLDYTVIGVVILMTLGVLIGIWFEPWFLMTHAHAQTTQFYDAHGRDAGTATTYGDTTTFHDNMGRDAGTATNYGSTTTFRDRMGRDSGSAVTTDNGTTYYDRMGREIRR